MLNSNAKAVALIQHLQKYIVSETSSEWQLFITLNSFQGLHLYLQIPKSNSSLFALNSECVATSRLLNEFCSKTRGLCFIFYRFRNKFGMTYFLKISRRTQNSSPAYSRLRNQNYSVGRFLRLLLSAIALPSPTFCSIIARTLSGSPNKVMNP